MQFVRARFVDSLVFFLLLSGPPKLRARDPTAALRAELDWAVLLQLAIWATGALWLFLRLYPIVVERGLLPRVWPPQIFGGMLLVGLFSSVWIAPGVAPTLYVLSQFSIMIGFSWVFVRSYGPEVYLRHLFWGYVILACAVFVAWMVMPELVMRRDRLRGDMIAPAGAVTALALVVWLSGMVRLTRRTALFIGGLLLVVLAVSQHRTSFAAFMLFPLLAWTFRCPSPIKRATPLIAGLIIVTAMIDFMPAVQQHIVREEHPALDLPDRDDSPGIARDRARLLLRDPGAGAALPPQHRQRALGVR
jgi:hypothetical protein